MHQRFARFRMKYILLSILFYFISSIVASSYIEDIKSGSLDEKLIGWFLIIFFLFGAFTFFVRAFPLFNFLIVNQFGFKYRSWPFRKYRKWSECINIKLTQGVTYQPTKAQTLAGQDKIIAFDFINPTFFERITKKTSGYHFALTENYNQNNYDLIKQIKIYHSKNS